MISLWILRVLRQAANPGYMLRQLLVFEAQHLFFRETPQSRIATCGAQVYGEYDFPDAARPEFRRAGGRSEDAQSQTSLSQNGLLQASAGLRDVQTLSM